MQTTEQQVLSRHAKSGKCMRKRQASQLLQQLLLLKLQQNDTIPHPNVELLTSDKGGRRNNFLYLLLVCVYLNNSYCPSDQLPPAPRFPKQRGQFTFQEKQCGQWPLESSRDLLLGSVLARNTLYGGLQSTKVTSSVHSTTSERSTLLCREDIPV